ncbi:MAG: SCP2 sterol-binding domain-containing protein [Agitococcus sp.]|nr:SCP2 sterol-binding domain-containing protein [Moraxellaceae bacterium]MBP9215844.1 SCP2 sterol-binding domain-containing protein [Agitococcus sp.]MBK9186808.1 SCP2 sterol-binding domain-containing protein [Moraxellaceae bacterium]MBL0231503.1 SCP2 sterol-binding domain-containing protein [Moraxellaceae bacterium]MCC6374271.1 SCP2 sterol-binding domain-containing protein [Moraxellaceae bacterium]
MARITTPMQILQTLGQKPIPKPLSRLFFNLPQFPPSMLLAVALNIALGTTGLSAIPSQLTGRQLRLVVIDAGLELSLMLTAKGFVPPQLPVPIPDVIIKANKSDFLAMAMRTVDADTLFFNRKLLMEGDTELGLLVRNLLDGVDFATLDATKFSPLRLFAATQDILRQRRGGRIVVW